MRRFLAIFSALLFAFAGWAQKAEMFHLEQSYDVPGLSDKDLYRRATSWYVDAGNQYNTVHDYVTEPYGIALEFVFRDVPSGPKYRDVSVRFRVSIVSKNESYTITLNRLLVSCYKGRKTIFCVEQIPEKSDGNFPDNRLLKDRLFISEMAKKYAKARFDELLPSIREKMEYEPSKLYLIQEQVLVLCNR